METRETEIWAYAYVAKFTADSKKQTVTLEIDFDSWEQTLPLADAAGKNRGVRACFYIPQEDADGQ